MGIWKILQIYTQEFLCQKTYAEADYGNADANQAHFPKTGGEGLILCHGGVVGKYENNGNDNQQHTNKSGDDGGEQKIGKNEENNRNQIRDSRIAAGFQRIVSSFALGG